MLNFSYEIFLLKPVFFRLSLLAFITTKEEGRLKKDGLASAGNLMVWMQIKYHTLCVSVMHGTIQTTM